MEIAQQNWRDGLAVRLRDARAERTRDALETDRLRRAVAGERAEPKTLRRFRRCHEDQGTVTDRVYGPEKAPESASVDSRDGAENRVDDDGHGDVPRSRSFRSLRSDASVREKQSASESVASYVGPASEVSAADDDDDDDGGGSGSRAARRGEWTADEWWSGLAEAEDEEAGGEPDETSFADAAASEPDADVDDRSETEQPRRLTDLEAYGLASTLEKHVDRMRVFEAMEGDDDDDDDDYDYDDDEKCDDGGPGPRTNKALVLRTLVRTARELRSHGTFESLLRFNADESRKAREERELRAECSSNRAALKGLRTDYESVWRVKEKQLAKKKSLLFNQYESITSLIKVEDDYFQARQQQQMSEEKELLNVEVRKLQKSVQDIDDRILNEDKCINEAKRIISSYTETIGRLVNTWNEMYSRDLGVIDREFMALEQEEKLIDELLGEWQAKVDQLNAQIDEHKKRKYEREEGNPA